MQRESSPEDQPILQELSSSPHLSIMPTSQVSGPDSVGEGGSEDQVKEQQPSKDEAKEVQSEPVKDEEEPSEGEAKEAQPESTAVRQEEQIDQDVETSWVPQGCTALRVPIFGKGAKGGKGPGKGAEGGKGG